MNVYYTYLMNWQKRLINENGWKFRTVYAKDKSGRIYEMSLNIGKSRDGRKILYDINNIKEIDSGDVASKGTQRNDQSLNSSKTRSKWNVNKNHFFTTNMNNENTQYS